RDLLALSAFQWNEQFLDFANRRLHAIVRNQTRPPISSAAETNRKPSLGRDSHIHPLLIVHECRTTRTNGCWAQSNAIAAVTINMVRRWYRTIVIQIHTASDMRDNRLDFQHTLMP